MAGRTLTVTGLARLVGCLALASAISGCLVEATEDGEENLGSHAELSEFEVEIASPTTVSEPDEGEEVQGPHPLPWNERGKETDDHPGDPWMSGTEASKKTPGVSDRD